MQSKSDEGNSYPDNAESTELLPEEVSPEHVEFNKIHSCCILQQQKMVMHLVCTADLLTDDCDLRERHCISHKPSEAIHKTSRAF